MAGLDARQLRQVREAVDTLVASGLGGYGVQELSQLINAEAGERKASLREDPRNWAGSVLVIGGSGVETDSLELDPRSGQWTPIAAQLGEARGGHAAAVLGRHLYVIGGLGDSDLVLATMERFDSRTGCWSQLPRMPTARCYLAAASACGRVFVLGGEDGAGRVVAAVESFDPKTGTWGTEPPLHSGRNFLAATALDGRVYALGGCGWRAPLTVAERITPRAGDSAWERLSGLRSPRWQLAAASLKGCVYAVGGYSRGNWPVGLVEVFQPAVGHWSDLPDLPTPRGGLAAAAVAGQLYVLGGYRNACLATVERWDPTSRTWARGPDLPSTYSCLASATLEAQYMSV